MMQETQASDLLRCGGLQRCSFMSLMALAQVKALHVSEDASHDFSHQKNFNCNPWDHLLVHLTSLMFLGVVSIFSIWIQWLPFGPHYFNAVYVPCNTLFYLYTYLLL